MLQSQSCRWEMNERQTHAVFSKRNKCFCSYLSYYVKWKSIKIDCSANFHIENFEWWSVFYMKNQTWNLHRINTFIYTIKKMRKWFVNNEIFTLLLQLFYFLCDNFTKHTISASEQILKKITYNVNSDIWEFFWIEWDHLSYHNWDLEFELASLILRNYKYSRW